ncbi:MAG: peptidoglycan DD-metalloendopeptidase family protein [bacterium]|nr:peptidoglycan DD-metalloendopeptidase family protein [bacterium]
MADLYLNPLDTAPVNRNRTSPRFNMPESVSFDEVLKQASPQSPAPMLKADALTIPKAEPRSQSANTPIFRPTHSENETKPNINLDNFHLPPDPRVNAMDQVKAVTPEAHETEAPASVEPQTTTLPDTPKPDATATSLFSAVNKKEKPEPVEPKPLVDSIPTKSAETAPVQPAVPADAAANEALNVMLSTYTVKRGDTLSEIVADSLRKQNIDYSVGDLYRIVGQVAQANQIGNPNLIYAGQKIDMSPVSGSLIAKNEPPKQTAMNFLDPIPSQSAQAPVIGQVTSEFGNRIHPITGQMKMHNGIDIAVDIGTPVQPYKDGQVIFSGNKGDLGEVVEVRHDDGEVSRYAHLSERLVNEGDRISMKDTLGLSGETGLTTGPHLHFEILEHGHAVNPMGHLPSSSVASL